ncbi:MAG TPA: restriction endonuclease subunit S [Acinetobacter parvus]|uniref:restriction endonuclease subunit S n=1 Tax=Acinetobacter parvus TaxID=134533 RepID=UPI002BE83CA7|nr:restriction endonuclease subunit S [Acinetobacter parvus]HRM16019.1 restriction endonuclease subunit S [Acinetobacter parvus]
MSSLNRFVTLGEISDRIGDGLHGTPAYSENGEYFFINGNNLLDGEIIFNEKTKSCSKFEYDKYKKDLSNNTILISINGTIGNLAFYKGENVILGKSACYINIKSDVDKNFIYYALKSSKFQNYIKSQATGSTIKNVSLKLLRDYVLELPDIIQQKRISKILSNLDEKINLNNQINQTLETIAQAIFKSWFIDFEPVRAKIAAKQEGKDPELAAMCAISGKTQAELDQLTKEDFAELQATAALFPDELVESELGTVPKGWSVQKIKDFGRVICGKTPSKSIAEYYGNDIPFIKIPDMHHDVFVLDSFEKLSEKGSNSQANKILPRGSICVSCIATVGKVIITHQPSQTNQQINSIVPDLPIYTYFLYFLMGEKERLFHDLASGGSATLNMNTSTFSNVDILMPNSKIIEAYDGVVSRIFDEILHNLKLSFLSE